MTDIALYKIVCFKDSDTRNEGFFVGDVSDVTNLECGFCQEGHSHLWNFDEKTHHIFKMGIVTHEEIYTVIKTKGTEPKRII